ncbi:hypothetical protein ACEWY4_007639 [Coilia grayii]|uniref:FERM and PDZ domain-containing protein 1 n=1 Tax=Coilia grayii TaxID=363190 RepID=A0ABD1KH90_9TELE
MCQTILGGPADGKLVPGDQPLKINNVAVDDLSAEQAADLIRECQDTLTITVHRITVGPKSSFITPEKRAKLRSNPVKVHFAEEVVVNGHCQGNSLLFLPNVLKVYLENGQTKAFKFEHKTRVKDIVMTLKEKLSITRIEHFSLLLEQQYSITKLVLLHEDELIQQVVEKKETHDYRCLFRVCFMPRDPQDLLDEDPVAFEYLYLQSVSDVLQERFAMEMKCNTALRLAALHIQERLASSGQSPKTPLKTITKEWGIESFVSNTLLRNMREKDLKKAISYHMKKTMFLEPRQKVISVNQARLNYLYEMAELKSFGGKSFSATMLLQDRESMVSLLVGVQYGVSQVVNHKLSVVNTLTEFSSITRLELIPESERVSLVKIYLQDIKPITLLLESGAAKDLSCLVAGYCRALVNPNVCVFPWSSHCKSPRISAEEGYVSHCGSDSEESDTDVDALLAHMASVSQNSEQTAASEPSFEQTAKSEGRQEKEETSQISQQETDGQTEEVEESVRAQETETKNPEENSKRMEEQRTTETGVETESSYRKCEVEERGSGGQRQAQGTEEKHCYVMLEEPASEASDSGRTDSRFLASLSSDSMDALEEDDLLTLGSNHRPSHLSVDNTHNTPPSSPGIQHTAIDLFTSSSQTDGAVDPFLSYAALFNMADCLPSPPEASEDENEGEQDLKTTSLDLSKLTPLSVQGLDLSKLTPLSAQGSCVFTFEQCDARQYYNICSNVTPDSARSLPGTLLERQVQESAKAEMEPVPILQPPPGFGDSSSDDEFFDAQERFTSPEQPAFAAITRENSIESSSIKRTLSLSDIGICVNELVKERKGEWQQDEEQTEDENALSGSKRKSIKQRRSFLETDYTSLVSYPDQSHESKNHFEVLLVPNKQDQAEDVHQTHCPTVSPLTNTEQEPAQLENKPITGLCGKRSDAVADNRGHHCRHLSAQVEMEVEPDAMETKAVTDLLSSSVSTVRLNVTLTESDLRASRRHEAEAGEGLTERMSEGLAASHLFFKQTHEIPAEVQDSKGERPTSFTVGHVVDSPTSWHPPVKIPAICYTPSPDAEKAEELPREVIKARSGSLIEAFKRSLAVSCESLTQAGEQDDLDSDNCFQASRKSSLEPTAGFLLTPCSPGSMIGRLSASTLRGKIQSLPFYLSRSHEALGDVNADNHTPQKRRFSETHHSRRGEEQPGRDMSSAEVTEVKVVTIVSEEVTEVIEEMVEVSHRGQAAQLHDETKADCPMISEQEANSEHTVSTTPSTLVVVTTQSIPSTAPHIGNHTHTHAAASGCGLFRNCESQPKDTQPKSLPSPCPHGKPELGCRSALALGCEVLLESAHAPLEVCDCQSVYTNCFSGVLDGNSFDDELTVYEFSCRTKADSLQVSPVSAIPPPLTSSQFSPLSSSSSPSPVPSFPCAMHSPSSSNELSPLLFPLEAVNCLLSDPEEEAIVSLLARRYPSPPAGFAALQRDLETLLSVLGGAIKSRGDCESLEHHRDSCAAHFSENKRQMHKEARGLLAGCQRVVRAGQTAEESLQALVQSFRSLVQLSLVCLCFSSCPRCRERHSQALTGLADVVRTYRELAHTAECVGSAVATTGKRSSCHDLSIKLLARQCTALTTSVFCLTQLFRTLTTL